MQNLLSNYSKFWASIPNLYPTHHLSEEKDTVQKFTDFYHSDGALFNRDHLPGHFTGSALVTNRTFDKVLLTLHAKLGKWLHLGGHADGDPDIVSVAMREAQEESGLVEFELVRLKNFFAGDHLIAEELPFDLDCHLIPASKKDSEHYHYDLTFLLLADENASLHITSESHDLGWFSIEEAMKITTERSMHRMFHKLQMASKYKVP